jgi:hypothetical protein
MVDLSLLPDLQKELAEGANRVEILACWADARHAESRKDMRAYLEKSKKIASMLNDVEWKKSCIVDANKALALIDKGHNPFDLSCSRGCRHCKTIRREYAIGKCALHDEFSTFSLNDEGNGCLDWSE